MCRFLFKWCYYQRVNIRQKVVDKHDKPGRQAANMGIFGPGTRQGRKHGCITNKNARWPGIVGTPPHVGIPDTYFVCPTPIMEHSRHHSWNNCALARFPYGVSNLFLPHAHRKLLIQWSAIPMWTPIWFLWTAVGYPFPVAADFVHKSDTESEDTDLKQMITVHPSCVYTWQLTGKVCWTNAFQDIIIVVQRMAAMSTPPAAWCETMEG